MSETNAPTPRDLIAAYVDAEPLPESLPEAEVIRIKGERRKAALAALQQVRDDAEEHSLAMHYAYRPEVTSEVSVPITEDADWEAIAKWCGGTIKSAPDNTDSGEWTSWIALPNGEEVSSGMWISKGLDGQFHSRYVVAEPDETTLRQAEAIGWESGARTAQEPNPNRAFLPSDPSEREAPWREGHILRVFLDKVNGLAPALICTEPTSAPCRQPYGDCELVGAFEEDPLATMENYRGPHLALLDAPIQVLIRDEYEIGWTVPCPSTSATGRQTHEGDNTHA